MLSVFLFLFSLMTSAAPAHLEVWFLSTEKKSALNELIDERIRFSHKMVERQCEKVGDYCFDPQYGLYRPESEWEAVPLKQTGIEGKELPKTGFDRNLIDCDKSNAFDIFCGKARAQAAAPKMDLEVWIDTSSSMREMDFTDEHGSCFRKSFMTRLDSECSFGKKLNIMIFDSSIKQLGSFDSLCINSGLNSTARMIDWIERSEVKNLILVTDINEYTKEFADFLTIKNAKMRGEKGEFSARSLLEEVSHLAKMCK